MLILASVLLEEDHGHSPYQAIKQADVLIQASLGAGTLSEADRRAVAGFAKTIKGYQFMIPANWVYQNGIRVDVADPLNPGDFVTYEQALDFIKDRFG
jgi:starch-binding outer membrane protein, SusD/RagB family